MLCVKKHIGKIFTQKNIVVNITDISDINFTPLLLM